jgi:hypothetical protein
MDEGLDLQMIIDVGEDADLVLSVEHFYPLNLDVNVTVWEV